MIWTTPQPIFDALDREFKFVIDLCADANNTKCNEYMSRLTSLEHSWDGEGWGWLNPPYGRDIAQWVAKASRAKRCIVGFLPGRTNAPWWHDYVLQATEIRFVRHKVSFANEEGCKGVPPWGAVVVIWQYNKDGGWRRRDGRPGTWECDAPVPTSVSSWDWRAA